MVVLVKNRTWQSLGNESSQRHTWGDIDRCQKTWSRTLCCYRGNFCPFPGLTICTRFLNFTRFTTHLTWWAILLGSQISQGSLVALVSLILPVSYVGANPQYQDVLLIHFQEIVNRKQSFRILRIVYLKKDCLCPGRAFLFSLLIGESLRQPP